MWFDLFSVYLHSSFTASIILDSLFDDINGTTILIGGEICHWLLLFQKFDFEIIVNPSGLNAGPYHLTRIETSEEPTNIEDGFPDAQLFRVEMVDDYYEQIVQFLATRTPLEELTTSQKK